MNPVRRRQLVLEQKPGGFDIGQDHALFDQLVCIVALLGDQAGDRSTLIKLEAVLDTFEFDRTPL